MIDTHAHIYDDEYRADTQAVIERAKTAGICHILLPNIDITSIEPMHQMEDTYPGYCRSMMGLHPTSVKEDYVSQLKTMEQWLSKRKYCAIGEIGMDLYWDKTYLKEQTIVFEEQLKWAKDLHLPVAIHVRKSIEHVLESLHKVGVSEMSGVFHAFSGSAPQEIIKLKTFKMGIGGVVTFKNASLQETLKTIPIDFIVTETDSPYLTPVPFRGKRNEPAYVQYIVEELATIYNLPVDEVKLRTTQNATQLFCI